LDLDFDADSVSWSFCRWIVQISVAFTNSALELLEAALDLALNLQIGVG
jgi:hypothetical protein